MSSFQQRLLIGGITGAIMFIILAWVPSQAWLGVERPILATRNFFNIFKIFNPSKAVLVLNLDKQTMRLMNQDLSSSASYDSAFVKEFMQSIVRNLDAENVSSVTIAINNLGGNLMSALNIQADLAGVVAPVDVVTQDFIVDDFKQEQSKTYLLDKTGTRYRKLSLTDFLNGKISPTDLQGKAIVIRSDFDTKSFQGSKINSVINYAAGNWLPYMKFHPILGFLLLTCAGVLFASTVVRARLLILGVLSAVVLVIGQLMYCFGNYLETVPVLLALITVCALSLAADKEWQMPSMPANNAISSSLETCLRKLQELKNKCQDLFTAALNKISEAQGFNEKIKFPDLPAMPNIQLPQMPHLQMPAINLQQKSRNNNISPALDMTDLRNKVYKELEYSLDILAKDFQQRTVAPLSSIQNQLEEILDRVELDITNQTKLELIKYDFEKVINELDTLLFTMVPFQFEAGRGILDPLDIYARKITEIYRGKPRIYLSPNAAHVELSSEEKANLFRIIQRLVECIIEENGKNSGLTHINIDVMHAGGNLTIKMTYDGLPIREIATNAKLREVARRADGIGLSVDLGFNWGEDAQAHLVNRIQLSMAVAEHEALTSIFPSR
jgi:hypothetical protein